MNYIEKDESFFAVMKFIQHLGLDKTLKYHNEIDCEISTNIKYDFYTDSIDIELDNLWGYALIFYPYLNTLGVGNKINSNKDKCSWNETDNILTVNIKDKIISFKKNK